MISGRKKWLFILLVAAVAWFVYDSLTQPGTQDLEGNFKETAFIRNEQNSGPVVRIYTVTTTDTIWTAMKQYGALMPHTKYGLTRVYFFDASNPVPQQLMLEGNNVPDSFRKYCLAVYEKNEMSQERLLKYPFK
ncbi:hypothetical protein [Pedobacter sp. SYSU D00535]|uniref:hypothetical protein n=1 Tax=Pedobacter sp. SYSU D00535 TaxID=2810308 RepID=UPI001A97392E|nr:hypothetical protein [Pedobacter sp. SYSU D00535]